MQKLTLSVDRHVIQRAKRYAEARETSVSRLVETLLDLIAAPTLAGLEPSPVLTRLRGSLKADMVARTELRSELQSK